jgi:putative transposon-encoded protein
MKIIKINAKSEIKVKNILGFVKRKVTKFGTSAKVDCPKEFLGRTVYLIITNE